MNRYYIFLKKLVDEKRLSVSGFAARYNIASLPTIMYKLRTGRVKRLHPETMGRIERALDIRIHDTSEGDITYIHQNELREMENNKTIIKLQQQIKEKDELIDLLIEKIDSISTLTDQLKKLKLQVLSKKH
ncbi:MAG: hypothetical protein ACM3SM_16015 [Bacteroidota bacterium]